MRRLSGAAVLVAGVAALAGCRSPLAAGADYDPAVPLGRPASFAWNEPDALPVGDPRLDGNPFFVERLHGAVARELTARGIRMAIGAPALLVHHHASVRERVEVIQADEKAGYVPMSPPMSPYGPGTQVYDYEEGTFLIDVVDARTNQVVWRGWARADLAGALEDRDALDQLVSQAVARMFEHFPVPVGSAPPVEEPPMIEPVPDIEEIPMPDVAAVPEALPAGPR
jgi:hypothetical protein